MAADFSKYFQMHGSDSPAQKASVLSGNPVCRRTEGTNTYVNLKSKDSKEFTCVINGGNLMSMGMTNPPMCNRKGEPIRTNTLHR